MTCDLGYGIPIGVVDNFALFQTGNRCPNLLKFGRFVKSNQDRLVIREILCFVDCFGWMGHMLDFNLKVMCCMFMALLL